MWFVPDNASPELRKKVWATVLAIKLFEMHLGSGTFGSWWWTRRGGGWDWMG